MVMKVESPCVEVKARFASEHKVLIDKHKGPHLGVRTARAYLRTVMCCVKDECSKHMDPTNTIRFVSDVLKCMQLSLSLCV